MYLTCFRRSISSLGKIVWQHRHGQKVWKCWLGLTHLVLVLSRNLLTLRKTQNNADSLILYSVNAIWQQHNSNKKAGPYITIVWKFPTFYCKSWMSWQRKPQNSHFQAEDGSTGWAICARSICNTSPSLNVLPTLGTTYCLSFFIKHALLPDWQNVVLTSK